jgi:hypothetical protein
MGEDERTQRRAELAEAAQYHAESQRRAEAQESAKAQVLIDDFVAKIRAAGVPSEQLTARPWSGSGRYRTDVVGWYLRRDHSIGVGEDGKYYLLVVPNERFGRFRTAHLEPTPPPLQVGKGGRDGDSIALNVLLATRLEWPR